MDPTRIGTSSVVDLGDGQGADFDKDGNGTLDPEEEALLLDFLENPQNHNPSSIATIIEIDSPDDAGGSDTLGDIGYWREQIDNYREGRPELVEPATDEQKQEHKLEMEGYSRGVKHLNAMLHLANKLDADAANSASEILRTM